MLCVWFYTVTLWNCFVVVTSWPGHTCKRDLDLNGFFWSITKKHCLFMYDRATPQIFNNVKRLELPFRRCSHWLWEPPRLNPSTWPTPCVDFCIDSYAITSVSVEVPSTSLRIRNHTSIRTKALWLPVEGSWWWPPAPRAVMWAAAQQSQRVGNSRVVAMWCHS